MAEATVSCFERAAEHVANYLAVALPSDKLLKLYGLYKQAVSGPCSTSSPNWFQVQAKLKWSAWKALGDMSSGEAMEQYVMTVRKLDPEWDDNSECETTKHASGWVSVSSMPKPDDVEEGDKTVFDWVKDGNVKKVEEYFGENRENMNINCLDENGMGLIHWAADRGHVAIVKLLVGTLDAQVDLRDVDGQTALHYAASCDHREVTQYLLDAGADPAIADNDGIVPLDVASSKAVAELFHSHIDSSSDAS